MTEIWKDVPGFEGAYQVSDQGRVRSLDRKYEQVGRSGAIYTHSRKGQLLAPGRLPGGHLSVALGRNAGSKCVHFLVALAFLGPRPAKGEIRHLNGDPADNRAANLAWGSRAENGQDKKWHGGQMNYKLSPVSVREMKRRMRAGETGAALSDEFEVAQSTVSAIKHGRFHKDVR